MDQILGVGTRPQEPLCQRQQELRVAIVQGGQRRTAALRDAEQELCIQLRGIRVHSNGKRVGN